VPLLHARHGVHQVRVQSKRGTASVAHVSPRPPHARFVINSSDRHIDKLQACAHARATMRIEALPDASFESAWLETPQLYILSVHIARQPGSTRAARCAMKHC
jgi:hypothetical protein